MISSRQSRVQGRLDRLAQVYLGFDEHALSPEQSAVLGHLRAAADRTDAIFWEQVCPEAGELRGRFAAEFASDSGLRRYFDISYGPYDALAGNEPFLPVPPRPPGAGFYPPDLTKAELLEALGAADAKPEPFLSPFTVIRRTNGGLEAIPYHRAYAQHVREAADCLRKAAAEAREELRQYLTSRAKSLETDDYFESDVQWVGLRQVGLDVAIGPFEVYEDGFMGIKASYEALVTLYDTEELQGVSRFIALAEDFRSQLSRRIRFEIPRAAEAPFLGVANLLYSAGEARRGNPAIAFSLPNDDRVIAEKGRKKVILKNVMQAKFEHVLAPISRALAGQGHDPDAASRGYLHHTVLHEICHSLGPRRIEVQGTSTTVNRSLGQWYTTLEEAKADVLGACWLVWMRDADPERFDSWLQACYVPGLVRSLRFGQAQAHGRSSLLQLNYLVARGAIETAGGLPKVLPERASDALTDLAREILVIQSLGDAPRAEGLVGEYCSFTPAARELTAAVAHLPVDIAIRFAD